MPTIEQIHEARETLSQIRQYARRLKRDAEIEPLMVKMATLMGRMWLAQARIIVREMNRRKVEAPLFEASPASWMDNIVGAAFADTVSFADSAEEIIAEAYGVGMVSGAGKIGIQGRFDLKNPRAVDVVRDRGAQLVKGINAETKAQMTTLLEQAASEGWSYTKTAKQITDKFKGFSGLKPQAHIRNRATLVAVTEIGQGYVDGNRAVYDVLRDEGLPMVKRWDDMGDARVSDGCRDNAAAGWIHYDKEFPSGDMAPLRFPGCRCDLEADMYDPSVHGGKLASEFPGFSADDWKYIYKEKYADITAALANQGLEILNPKPAVSDDLADEPWRQWNPMRTDREYLANWRGVDPADLDNPVNIGVHCEHALKQMGVDITTATPEEIERALRQLADEVSDILNTAKVSTYIPDEDVLAEILKDGRFKTQFETGTSQGVLDERFRAIVERDVFGIDKDMPDKYRPFYGFLDNIDPNSNDAANSYGEVRVVFKDSVKSRTTWTNNDSLSQHRTNACAPASGFGSDLTDLYATQGYIKPYRTLSDRTPAQNAVFTYVYNEAQIHGGLPVSDIEHVVLPYKAPKVQDMLDQLGIPWSISNV